AVTGGTPAVASGPAPAVAARSASAVIALAARATVATLAVALPWRGAGAAGVSTGRSGGGRAVTTGGPAAARARVTLLLQAHGQGDAVPRDVDGQDLDLDHVAGLGDVARVGDERVRHRGDVDEAVLVDADVNERAEGGDVRHDAFEAHAGLQVAEGLHALGEGRGLELGPRVAAWLFEFLKDVGDRGQAERLVGELGRVEPAQRLAVADEGRHIGAGLRQDAADHRVRLGVHARGVERVVAALDAQEARALLEGLRAEPGDVLELLSPGERAARVAVRHDRARERVGDAGNPGEERAARGVDVDADGVHGVFHDRVQGALQLGAGDVVLVLADADGLRVDLDEFGERVLQPPGDAHRAAQGHVEVGKLAARV